MIETIFQHRNISLQTILSSTCGKKVTLTPGVLSNSKQLVLHSAYVNPVVDKSPDKFSWGVPDVEGLVAFCNRHMGWSEDETRRTLEPVVLRAESGDRYRQTRLDKFMSYSDGIKVADVRSKRLREVLGLKEDLKPSASKKRTP